MTDLHTVPVQYITRWFLSNLYFISRCLYTKHAFISDTHDPPPLGITAAGEHAGEHDAQVGLTRA
jgi:hypothetical protein